MSKKMLMKKEIINIDEKKRIIKIMHRKIPLPTTSTCSNLINGVDISCFILKNFG
jgi:hypothetical protein